MKTAHQHTFRKIVANTKQLEELNLNYHQDIATQAMMASLVDSLDEDISYNDEENSSYVLGYN